MRKSKDIGIALNWASFTRHIFGDKKPSDVQYREMRRAFYAGYVAAFTDLSDRVAALSEEAAMQKMSVIEAEIIGYVQELRRGEG